MRKKRSIKNKQPWKESILLIKKKRIADTFFIRNKKVRTEIDPCILSKQIYELTFEEFASAYAVSSALQSKNAKQVKIFLDQRYVSVIIQALKQNISGIIPDAIEYVRFRSKDNMQLVKNY